MVFRWSLWDAAPGRPPPPSVDEFVGYSEKLIAVLKPQCKRWAFQIEKTEVSASPSPPAAGAVSPGPAGALPPSEPPGVRQNWHYQGYVFLKVKRRPSAFAKDLHSTFHGFHADVSQDSANAFANAWAYVHKPESRVHGPWDSDGLNPVSAARAEALSARRLAVLSTPRPFQKFIMDHITQEPDGRSINILYDPVGCSGKSALALALELKSPNDVAVLGHGHGRHLTDLLFSHKDRRCYIFDLTRAKPADIHRDDLYSVIEQCCCNGKILKQFGSTGAHRQSPSHAWVFTNTLPNLSAASTDRWKIFRIVDFLQYDIAPMSTDEVAAARLAVTLKELDAAEAGADQWAAIEYRKLRVAKKRKAALKMLADADAGADCKDEPESDKENRPPKKNKDEKH